ncbi:hypothetical protein GCM10010121_003290 [Streptomyces brasiliensis]|uniref:Uncharacterized protein n=1 Tax=Streptomyces brasiliensis TaxID=1954 RepID=A0A917NFL6_9ACTN|nr:hypothetical protein GCM10010121_003290 [Streptomyces brasiliensis]
MVRAANAPSAEITRPRHEPPSTSHSALTIRAAQPGYQRTPGGPIPGLRGGAVRRPRGTTRVAHRHPPRSAARCSSGSPRPVPVLAGGEQRRSPLTRLHPDKGDRLPDAPAGA